jgi:hypothetical protein
MQDTAVCFTHFSNALFTDVINDAIQRGEQNIFPQQINTRQITAHHLPDDNIVITFHAAPSLLLVRGTDLWQFTAISTDVGQLLLMLNKNTVFFPTIVLEHDTATVMLAINVIRSQIIRLLELGWVPCPTGDDACPWTVMKKTPEQRKGTV